MSRHDIEVDVLIIGGGPAGLTAAAGLASRVRGPVVVLDREQQAGGIPRHSNHVGYGIRDLKKILSGPAYAKRLLGIAHEAGADIRPGEMVTNWCGTTSVEVTAPSGRYRITARAVVLATGARERPRSARLVPGDRPAGVLTTGQLQNLVHLHHADIGRAAVIVGAELVSWSAVLTLREAGARTVLMTTTHPSPESYGVFNLAGKYGLRVPVATRTAVTRIIGKGRVRAIEVEDLATGRRREIGCDTVVFTGDWIPDHELARAAGIDLNRGTLGPLVDSAQRTSEVGVFAIGNLVHPVDTADVAALDGTAVIDPVVAYLASARWPASSGIRLRVEAPLSWISPGILRPDDPPPPRRRYLLWTEELVRVPRVVVRQDGKVLARKTVAWPASPGRVFRLPSSLLRTVDPDGGEVIIGLV